MPRRALGTMLADPALGAEHVRRLLPAAGAATARAFYDRYVGSWFKADGQPDPGVVATALPLVAEELRIVTGHAVDVPPADRIYRADLTAAWTPEAGFAAGGHGSSGPSQRAAGRPET